MEQLLEQMKLGFNKADLDKLEGAFQQAVWSFVWAPSKQGNQREYFVQAHRTLGLLRRQETQFEYYVGLPERA